VATAHRRRPIQVAIVVAIVGLTGPDEVAPSGIRYRVGSRGFGFPEGEAEG